jgi:hypothetical protein
MVRSDSEPSTTDAGPPTTVVGVVPRTWPSSFDGPCVEIVREASECHPVAWSAARDGVQEEVAHQGEYDETGCQKRSRELTYYHGEICGDGGMVYHREETPPVEGSTEAGREVQAVACGGNSGKIYGVWGTLLTGCRGQGKRRRDLRRRGHGVPRWMPCLQPCRVVVD